MRRFEELPLEDGLALIDVLVEQGLITEDHCVTPLGEEYIASAKGDTPSFERTITNAWFPPVNVWRKLETLDEDDEIDTRPLSDLCNTDSIEPLGVDLAGRDYDSSYGD